MRKTGTVYRFGVWVTVSLPTAFLAVQTARANIRAPRLVPESPSSALAAPAEPLTVERELLTFLCGSDSCLVTARYDVTAVAATRVELDFILPVESTVTATTNAAERSVQVAPASPLREEERKTLPAGEPGAPPLFRAAFVSELREGANSVTVKYTQPLGAEETDYGYGKKAGRMVQRFRYELWPLREWKRSASFRAKLAIAIDRPAPSWWKRRFGNSRSVACLTSDATNPVPSGRLEQRGGKLWYEADLGPGIPDRITCYVGDEDLMPRY